jgi:single-strand DNA-binding protein
MYDNSVRLIGFLGQNAEKRTARNKTPYVILNLATTIRWRAKESKENVKRTEWHRLVVIWNQECLSIWKQKNLRAMNVSF